MRKPASSARQELAKVRVLLPRLAQTGSSIPWAEPVDHAAAVATPAFAGPDDAVAGLFGEAGIVEGLAVAAASCADRRVFAGAEAGPRPGRRPRPRLLDDDGASGKQRCRRERQGADPHRQRTQEFHGLISSIVPLARRAVVAVARNECHSRAPLQRAGRHIESCAAAGECDWPAPAARRANMGVEAVAEEPSSLTLAPLTMSASAAAVAHHGKILGARLAGIAERTPHAVSFAAYRRVLPGAKTWKTTRRAAAGPLADRRKAGAPGKAGIGKGPGCARLAGADRLVDRRADRGRIEGRTVAGQRG